MKLYFLIALIFTSAFAFGQSENDTTISKSSLEGLMTVIYMLKNENFVNALNYNINSNLGYTDTLFNTKDSLVVNFISKSGVLLKQQNISFFSSSDIKKDSFNKNDSTNFYYDSLHNVVYVECWSLSVPVYDTEGEGKGGYGILKSDPTLLVQARISYDKKGREVFSVLKKIAVDWAIKSITKYNESNKAEVTREAIPFYRFWD